MATYTVKKGDTLLAIAKKYNPTYKYGNTDQAALKRLAAINDINNIFKIHVGQKLTLDNPSGAIKKKTNNSLTPIITAFGIQSDSENTVFATWRFDKANTKEYKVMWYYSSGDGVWFVGSDSTESYNQSTYNPPSNAIAVKFKVKAIAKTHKVTTKKKVKKKNGKTTTKKVTKDVAYWTGTWSAEKLCNFAFSQEPAKPSAPSLSIDGLKLTASCENLADGVNIATQIQFRVLRDNIGYQTSTATVLNRSASYFWYVSAGYKYKVQCRAIRNVGGKSLYSDWSDYSSETATRPPAPSGIVTIRANSSTEIYLGWNTVPTATSYEVQYTLKKYYFDSNPDAVTSKTVEAVSGPSIIISGLDDGGEYFFRLRAKNDQGESEWTGIKSCIVGQKPAPPTTWSSTTTAIIGEDVTLYWVHNTKDNSKATMADLELLIDGVDKSPAEFTYSYGDDDKEPTYTYVLDTDDYVGGGKVQWRVRTAGVTREFSDWSVQRTIDMYPPASLGIDLRDADGNSIESIFKSFPVHVVGEPGPSSQSPIGYHLSVVAYNDYETEDQVGNVKMVHAGEELFSKFYDIKEPLDAVLSADNIDLENGQRYNVICVVTMSSGLTAEDRYQFEVDWVEEEYGVDAEIIYNDDTYSCSIRPYCYTTPEEYYEDDSDSTEEPIENPTPAENEEIVEILVENVTLAVYRRDYNGEFVEIASGLANTKHTFVTDPHPALDYARYRIVATSKSTGAISYIDIPGYPIEETSVIIQWNEKWNNLVTSIYNPEDDPEEPVWAGSMVILPYNIDVSDKNDIDVSLVKYIGRKRPVSYYGTQLGETASWKVEIPKDDEETLYALRRLAIWTGDVYVREPSGSGYWANISVSMSQTHCQLTIPVTIEITRVEGGV